jgi:ferric-chelate reductase (NADPH)
MNDADAPPSRKRPGLLESAIRKLFTRSGQVLEIEDVGATFRIITVGGEALCKAEWTPGDKVQLQLGSWVQRTYTPIDWDAEAGRMRILAYVHGNGPGADWARTLRKGDACVIFGPRKSIDLTRLRTSAVLFGDETSFGLASALLGALRPSSTRLLFEVASLAQAQPALTHVGLSHAQLHVRGTDDTHLVALEEDLLAQLQAEPTANIVLSGKASSIQRISRLLKRSGIASSRVQSRAYWATGKTGLD